jgi:TolA-binding protein
MATLTVIWNFLKAHWQTILLVVVLAVGFAWVKRQNSLNAAAIAQLNQSHQQEIDTINKARQDEETQHQQELQQYQQQLAQIQQEYAAAQAQLQQQQTQEQNNIVQKYHNDAAGLADLTASKFGFVVQVPPDTTGGSK